MDDTVVFYSDVSTATVREDENLEEKTMASVARVGIKCRRKRQHLAVLGQLTACQENPDQHPPTADLAAL